MDPYKKGFALRIALEHARYAEQQEARAIVDNLQQQTDQGCQFANWLTEPAYGEPIRQWGSPRQPKLSKAERDRWHELFDE